MRRWNLWYELIAAGLRNSGHLIGGLLASPCPEQHLTKALVVWPNVHGVGKLHLAMPATFILIEGQSNYSPKICLRNPRGFKRDLRRWGPESFRVDRRSSFSTSVVPAAAFHSLPVFPAI